MNPTPPPHSDPPQADPGQSAAPQPPPPGEAAPTQAQPPSAPGADETVKETIESIVIAFILAFVFRAFVVEPFIIPTGSMAPTMLGEHLQMNCPSCGYAFDVGADASIATTDRAIDNVSSADCPMCHYPVVADRGTNVRSGDRILVDKFSYHLADPSRWDIVVFKAPKDQVLGGEPAPRTNFIKRLVALPGERVALLDGNVFVAPAGTNNFTIARKTDPRANHHWQAIQRAVWQPLYHSQHVPIESGLADGPGRDSWHRFRVPWRAESGHWDLGSARRPKRVYTFKGGGSGQIRFAMHGEEGTIDYDEKNARFSYNQMSSASWSDNPIEDIRLACAVTPATGQGSITLSTTARLDTPGNGVETLSAKIYFDGQIILKATAPSGASRELGEAASVKRLRPGIATTVELWLVDDEASVWVNGERALVYPFDLTWDELAKRPDPAPTPEITITAESDGAVELRRVELDRDLFYFAERYPSSGFARAEAVRRDGQLQIGPAPLDLRTQSSTYDAEFFVLGDNQPASEDGRGWSSVDGWVQRRYFGGDERQGVVPRSLLVGRAFMVYYPAPRGMTPQDKGVIPSFGRMRFVH